MSVSAVSVDPSPQSIVYLLALPTVVIVRVLVNGAPPLATSTVVSTLLTKVLFLTFSIPSFSASIASVTEVPVVSVCTAPSVQLLSVESPNVNTPAFDPATTLSSCALVTKCVCIVPLEPFMLVSVEPELSTTLNVPSPLLLR